MDVKEDCSNVLHLILLMLIVPFTNAKVERLFSRMNRAKTDLRSWLSHNHLDVCLKIGGEDVAVDAYNPYPVIELWLSERVHHLKSGSHNLSKHVKIGLSCEGNYIDLVESTLPNLEISDNEFLGF